MGDTPPSQGTEQDPGQSGSERPVTERVDDLEEGQSKLTEKIDELLGLVRGGGKPPEHPAPPAGGGSADSQSAATVQEQVAAELARRDKARADQEAADADRAEREGLKAAVAQLAERPPAAPIRRATKMLGWGDGR